MFPNQYNNATENYPNPDIEVNLSDILDSLDPGRAKAQDDLENGDEEENGTENIIQEKISITPGMSFDTKALAIEKSKAFFAQNFHPFITASSGGDSKGPDDKSKGRIRFVCTHGHRRKYIATDIRPKQRVNQTGCQAGFNLNEQVNGTWKVGSKVIIEHIGHIIGPEIYNSYSFVKQISKEDEEFVQNLHNAKAPNRKIADVLTARTGYSMKSRDVVNLINKLKKNAPDGDVLDKDLEEIRDEGGEVKWNIDKDSGFMDVLFILTKAMKEQVLRVKPTVFQCDTTFNTNSQGFKLFIPVYQYPHLNSCVQCTQRGIYVDLGCP